MSWLLLSTPKPSAASARVTSSVARSKLMPTHPRSATAHRQDDLAANGARLLQPLNAPPARCPHEAGALGDLRKADFGLFMQVQDSKNPRIDVVCRYFIPRRGSTVEACSTIGLLITTKKKTVPCAGKVLFRHA